LNLGVDRPRFFLVYLGYQIEEQVNSMELNKLKGNIKVAFRTLEAILDIVEVVAEETSRATTQIRSIKKALPSKNTGITKGNEHD
jgi:hypothetical protein